MSEPQRCTLLVCPVCGRNDRYSTLGRNRHYARGGIACSGQVVDVEFVEAAPVEAELKRLRGLVAVVASGMDWGATLTELERLRKIEAAAREVWRIECEIVDDHLGSGPCHEQLEDELSAAKNALLVALEASSDA